MKTFWKTSLVIFGIVSLIGLSSCKEEEVFNPVAQLEKEITAIDKYLDENGLTAVKDPTGVRIVISQLGTELPAQGHHSIDVDYVGKLFSNNQKFDEGTIAAPLNNMIVGWQIALRILPKGSVATLYIPSYYAYGANGKGSIPANSTLVFDITFTDIIKAASEINKLASDVAAIKEYLSSKAITNATEHETGVHYVITTEGTGVTPTWYSRLHIKTAIKLLTNDQTVVYTLEQEPSDLFHSRTVDVVQGLTVALMQMKSGTKATVYVPSGLGYGTSGATAQGDVVIPPNSNLIFEIEVFEVL